MLSLDTGLHIIPSYLYAFPLYSFCCFFHDALWDEVVWTSCVKLSLQPSLFPEPLATDRFWEKGSYHLQLWKCWWSHQVSRNSSKHMTLLNSTGLEAKQKDMVAGAGSVMGWEGDEDRWGLQYQNATYTYMKLTQNEFNKGYFKSKEESNRGRSLSWLMFPLLWQNTKTRSKLGKKGFYLTVSQQAPSLKEVREGVQAGTKRVMEGCCLLDCPACFLLAPRTTSPGVTPPTESYTLPHQLSINKMHHRSIWQLYFLSWASFFSYDLACVKLI